VRAGWTGWRRELGWLLIGFGVLIACAGVVPLTGASMPFQDPTHDMLVKQASDVRQAEVLLVVGVLVGTVAFTTGVLLVVWARRPTRPVR
jgi:hypothetical protein